MKRFTIGLVSISVLAGLAVYPVAGHRVSSNQHVARALEEGFTPIENIIAEGPTPIENIIEERPTPIDNIVAPEPVQPVTPIPVVPEIPVEIPRPELPAPPQPPAPPQEGAIKVIKFKDLNGNSVEDEGEVRMSGILFHLDQGSQSERQGVTDQNGEILWLNLAVSAHNVHEVVPSGFIVTTPNPQSVTVVVNQTAVVKFGNRPVITPQKARLEIIKVKDENGNGSCEKGEPGISGVKFTIKKDGNVIATGTTNVAGLVEFDVDAGTFLVLEEVPAGFEVIGDNPQTVTLGQNEDKALAFCNKPIPPKPQKAAIKVMKFKDLNGNGREDAGEPRLQGVKFTANGKMEKATDANGEANWVELDLGEWKIVEQVPAGFRATTATEQNANLTENGQTVTLHFGNQPIELPPTGVFNVLVPSSVGVLGTLYTMVRRQRRYTIDLLRNL